MIISELDQVFNTVVHFRKNLFVLPSGQQGKRFVKQKAKFFQAMADGDGVAMKAQAVMEHLLLQRIKGHKTKQHKKTLEMRLQKWENGDLLDLLVEAQDIQDLLPERSQTSPKEVSRFFSKLI